MLGRSFFAACALAAILATATTTATATAMEADEPARNMAVDIAAHTHLADATGLVNKNTVLHGNNVAIAKSNVLARQDDDIALEHHDIDDDDSESEDEAMPAAPAPAIDSDVPTEIVETGEKESLMADEGNASHELYVSPYGYRYRFYYPYGGGFRYGWRYPIAYWNRYGYSIYGTGCGYRRFYGGYYYC